ncbi:hypothetical protein [Ekhidna sp.]
MKLAILSFLLVLVTIGRNAYRIYSGHQYDMMDIISQVGFIVAFTLIGINSLRKAKRENTN